MNLLMLSQAMLRWFLPLVMTSLAGFRPLLRRLRLSGRVLPPVTQLLTKILLKPCQVYALQSLASSLLLKSLPGASARQASLLLPIGPPGPLLPYRAGQALLTSSAAGWTTFAHQLGPIQGLMTPSTTPCSTPHAWRAQSQEV